jgi:type II secretory pathway predicted ATPase ExeA
MYQPYWGLTESPFRGNFDQRFFYQGPSQDEALARLHFLVDEKRAMGLLLSEAGGGKSLVLQMFARQIRRVGRQKASINLIGLDAHEFLWLVAMRLGAEVSSSASQIKLFQAVSDHLVANHYQQLTTVLLLDDADEARVDVKDCIVRLAESSIIHDASLTIVLAAQISRLQRLGRRLLELAELRIDLDRWEEDDTSRYVKSALAAAGRSIPLFSDAALVRLHELGGGIPRRVKQLADLSLLAGAGANLSQIEAETIQSAFGELGILAGEAPLTVAAAS